MIDRTYVVPIVYCSGLGLRCLRACSVEKIFVSPRCRPVEVDVTHVWKVFGLISSKRRRTVLVLQEHWQYNRSTVLTRSSSEPGCWWECMLLHRFCIAMVLPLCCAHRSSTTVLCAVVMMVRLHHSCWLFSLWALLWNKPLQFRTDPLFPSSRTLYCISDLCS